MATLPRPRLSIQDVADLWNCSYRHIWDLVNKGELPAIRIGSQLVRIRPEDVERFEAEGPAPWDDPSSPDPITSSDDTTEFSTSAGQKVVALSGGQLGAAIAAGLKRY